MADTAIHKKGPLQNEILVQYAKECLFHKLDYDKHNPSFPLVLQLDYIM